MKKRNLNKVMGLILSAIMIISTAFMTVNADAVNTIDFTQDFENATADNCGLKLVSSAFETIQVGNSKVLSLLNTSKDVTVSVEKEIPTIESGKLAVDFTMRILPEQYTRFLVFHSESENTQIFNTYFNGSGQFALGINSKGYPYNDEQPHWIKAHFIFNVDSKKLEYLITDEYDNIIVDSSEMNISKASITKIKITTQLKAAYASAPKPLYLDDIRITNTNITDLATVKAELSPVKARILPISDDFDSYADINAVKKEWTVPAAVTTGDNKRDTTIDEKDGNKRIKLNGYDAGAFKSIASNPIESGKIKVSADVVPSNMMFGLVINGKKIGDSIQPLFHFRTDAKVYSFGIDTAYSNVTYISDFTKGTEYHLEALIDMDTKKMNVKMTGKNGDTTDVSVENIDISKYHNEEVKYINGFGIKNYGNATYDTTITYFDNFEVKYDGLNAPSLAENKVEFYDDDIKGNVADLSPNTNKITLDFGTVMDQLSLHNKISLTDSNGANVSYKATFSKNVYTLKIPGRLKASETYTLTVPANVENELGGTLEGGFTMTFTTNAGEVSATISPKNAAGDVIDGLSGLSTGDEIKAEISYKNSTGEAVSAVAIFAYFDGDILRDVSLEPITISADDKTGEATITHTVKDLTDTKNMKIMFWNINTIEPFAEYIDLK